MNNNPIMFLVVGLLIVWFIFTGRATRTWVAMTGSNAERKSMFGE